VNTVCTTPDEALELQSLESEIIDVRRYILRNRSSSDIDKVWMQVVWSDLLLDRWSVVAKRVRSLVPIGQDGPGQTAPCSGRSVRALPNAAEPLTLAGLDACLQGVPDLVVVADSGTPSPQVDVCVHATERVDADFVTLLRASAQRFDVPAVVVTNRIDKADLDVLASCRVLAVLPRLSASSGRLVNTVRTVGAHQSVPGPDLLAGLLEHA
jgi:hypothetical protein